ncbi:MAG TPA: hypothetical protein VKQ72_07450 [Aggregatilineales bacterium]|nr:hypothetical protein [Aggregatilineales bacterium]
MTRSCSGTLERGVCTLSFLLTTKRLVVLDTRPLERTVKMLFEHAVEVILAYIPIQSVAIIVLDESRQWLHGVVWRVFADEPEWTQFVMRLE